MLPSFKLNESQNERLAMAFCDEVRTLVNSKRYTDDVLIKTVDSILDDLTEKNADLKIAIQTELKRCWPYIQWSFNSKLPEAIPCGHC